VRRAFAVLALVAVAAVGCSDQGPLAGDLSLRLVTSRTDIRAILFRVTGRQHGVTAAAGSAYRVLSDTSAAGDTSWIAVIAPQGGVLAAGELLRLAVPDTRNIGGYRTALTDVAGADYSVGNIAGIRLTVVNP
jgi:hypothetical protein